MSNQRILFAKYGTAKYISHLDLMHTMERAFLRAGIAIRHTEGFHPHPYVSIPLPLPLGFSSRCEILEFGLVSGSTMEDLPAQMNAVLPAGLEILRCYDGVLPFRKLAFVRYDLTMEFENEVAEQAADAFRELVNRESLVVTKRSKKSKTGQTQVDLIPLIDSLEALTPEGAILRATLLLQAQNPGLNPDILLRAFQAEYQPMVYTACHRREILSEEKQIYR